MTGRPKGATQQTKRNWYSSCNTCHTNIINEGSGTPKKYCSQRCRAKSPTRLEQMRNYARKKSKPKNTKVVRQQTNKEILIAYKRLQNECVLHMQYWGTQEFVDYGYEYLMDMDHIDRTKKHKNIAKMMSEPEARFRAEMVKCQMVCKKCHGRKTVENREWESITKPLEPMIVKIYNQPSLFDIDPA